MSATLTPVHPATQIRPGTYGFPVSIKKRYNNYIGGKWVDAVAGKTFKLEPAAEKLRRTAFIGDDVSVLVTKHDSPRRRDLRKRQCVRGRAGRPAFACTMASRMAGATGAVLSLAKFILQTLLQTLARVSVTQSE